MAEKTASFAVDVKAGAPGAREAATELEALRSKIEASQDAVKNYGAELRRLRGASDEVKSARTDLKAKIEAERDAVSRASLTLLKQGTTYEALARSHRDESKASRAAEERAKMLREAMSHIGGPVSELREKLDGLKTVFGGVTSAQAAMAVGATALLAGVAAVAAAIAVLTAGLIGATVAFGKWVIEGANAVRTMNLMREAAGGTAQNATALGHQVDALAGKLATPKAELNELALSLTRALLGTRVSGQGIVDTFNAVAQASEAMGKQAGSQIESILERGKRWGRMSLGLFELQGTGITFEDVAGNLSKNLKVGLEQARFSLVTGMVKVDDGARAIREAVERRFARINLAKMLDLDVLKLKFREAMAALTAGINVEPLAKAIQSVTELFTDNTVAGVALKDIVTDLGQALVGKAASGADLLRKAIKQVIIWAYQADIAFLKWRKGITDTHSKFLELVSAKDIVNAIKVSLVAVGVVIASATAAVAGLIGAFALVGKAVGWLDDLSTTVSDFGDKLRATAGTLGKALIDGIIEGVKGAWGALTNTVSSVADSVKNTFKNMLGIHSPSAEFREYGHQTVEGYSRGVEARSDDSDRAIGAMAPKVPESGGGAGGTPRGGPVSVTVNITAGAGAGGHDAAKQMSSPEFLAQLTKAIEEALVGAGIPTQAQAGA